MPDEDWYEGYSRLWNKFGEEEPIEEEELDPEEEVIEIVEEEQY